MESARAKSFTNDWMPWAVLAAGENWSEDLKRLS
jgi:hypothetical protein